jgi:ABC-2 type transport system ATP-binding protein
MSGTDASAPAGHAIAVRDISKVFPRRHDPFLRPGGPPVLSNVTFDVRFGEVFGILGPNGAGKTTLIEILATLIEPTSGTAAVCGSDVVRAAARVRSSIGYSGASSYAFYPRLTGAHNLELFASLYDLPRAHGRDRVRGMLEQVGLSAAAQSLVQTYSEGMKQRLSLARALLADPPVLLLDEPSRSLDATFRETFQQSLRRRVAESPGRAVVLVTHSLFEADTVCDRGCFLDRGTVISTGRIADLERRAPGPRSLRATPAAR